MFEEISSISKEIKGIYESLSSVVEKPDKIEDQYLSDVTSRLIKLRVRVNNWKNNTHPEATSYHKNYQNIGLQFYYIFYCDELYISVKDSLKDATGIIQQLTTQLDARRQKKSNVAIAILTFYSIPSLMTDLFAFLSSDNKVLNTSRSNFLYFTLLLPLFIAFPYLIGFLKEVFSREK